ncbi:hypothetical protein L1987_74374 [Smallanthus sonchifolius]|uniref:Uncharacterized protein n=1 Tax=Smallanthus sonchifolius TaxID=185202 RepID=A0ACB9A1S6_9ASTR|nr:hypothetical protein L1987_74374 [Smallanthus sonchifolius]
MFSEGSFRDDDVLAVYLGFYLGNPLFGRVDDSIPEILHMRDIYGRGRFEGLRVEGFECGGDLRESDVGLDCNTPRQSCKDVAADSLKAIRRKLVPADNLKQSVANPLLLKIKPVSS